jgi:hypothetical protein
VLFPRCSAYVYESTYGFHAQTNFHVIQAEAQREYGLTPDDVHDSFNLFMFTEVQAGGTVRITRQDTRPGDHVELLALVDTLAVPNVCGADVMRTSNFFLKPVKVQLLQAAPGIWRAYRRCRCWPASARPRTFAMPAKPTANCGGRRLQPQFLNTPLQVREVAELDDEELALLRAYEHRAHYGDDLATLRDCSLPGGKTFRRSPNGAQRARRASLAQLQRRKVHAMGQFRIPRAADSSARPPPVQPARRRFPGTARAANVAVGIIYVGPRDDYG